MTHSVRRSALALGVLLASILWILTQAPPTAAHAFLIQGEPVAGQRLVESPVQVSLLFTEAVLPPRADRVTLSIAQGHAIPIGRLVRSDGGMRLAAKIPRLVPGVYLVRWQVVSAVDGHYQRGALPLPSGTSPARSRSHVRLRHPTGLWRLMGGYSSLPLRCA